MSDIADKLREARKLIERGWCQGDYAVLSSGDGCWWYDKRAVAWCALGAIRQAADGEDRASCAYMPLVRALESANNFCAGTWNDAHDRTQAEVLAAFDRAIALAEQEAQ